jgi:hypothetical protein
MGGGGGPIGSTPPSRDPVQRLVVGWMPNLPPPPPCRLQTKESCTMPTPFVVSSEPPFQGDPSHQRPLCGPEFSDVYSIGPDYLRPVYAALCVRFSGMTAETTSALVICRPLTPGPQKVTNHTTGKPHKSRA